MATTARLAAARVDNNPPAPATLHTEREQIDITTRHEPDPNWEHVDPAGHYHARANNGDDPASNYPTLLGDVEHVDCNGTCGGDCEGYDTTVWRCRACGDVVQPGSRETDGRRYMDGLETWTVTVEQHITATGPVSVVVDAGGVRHFGMARAAESCAESGPDGYRVWTVLVGITRLGRKPHRAVQAPRHETEEEMS